MTNLKSMQILIIGYVGIIILGALLLFLPCMHSSSLSFIEALFTSTSAFTCTGLIIKDTALDFTPFGQAVILALIWLGGLGYMSMLGIVYVFLRKRLSNRERNMIKESLNYPSYDGMMSFLKKVLLFVILIESFGALALFIYFYFVQDFSVFTALWAGIFHAISAFNNAGFSIFSTNLMAYRQSVFVNSVICLLIIAGGMGYIVLIELHTFIKSRLYVFWNICLAFMRNKPLSNLHTIRLSLHSKIVVSYTFVLLTLGFGFIFVLEYHNPKSMGNFEFFDKILSSFFMSVNYRTSGFNSIDLGGLKDSTMFFSSLLMIIGGAPGGTAGGIKVTTLATLLAFCAALFYDTQPRLFKRRIMEKSVKKAIGVGIIAMICITLANFIIAALQEDTRFMLIMFEVSSAFATTGVSAGNGGTLSLSANFSPLSQIVIIGLMLMGKVGILAFWQAFVGKRKQSYITLQEERVII